MSVEVIPTGAALGAEIRGVDLSRPLDEASFAAIERAYNEHGVIFFRNQQITPQQQVAFKKSKSMVGRTVEVLIDRPHGDSGSFVARTQSQAPDIDSVTYVSGSGLHAGQLVNVKVTDYQAYDLVAKVPAPKRKGLQVISA